MAHFQPKRGLSILLGLSMMRVASPYGGGVPRAAPAARLICMGGGGGKAKKSGGSSGGFGKTQVAKKRPAAAGRSSGLSTAARADGFPYTGKMRPGRQSPTRVVPASIAKPDYAADGRPKAGGPLLPWQIEVNNKLKFLPVVSLPFWSWRKTRGILPAV